MIKFVQRGVLFFIAMMAMVGCNVDESYDLSNLDSDGFGFGTDETSFEIPLFKVTFSIPDESYESYGSEETKASSFSFDVESILEGIELGEDILDILEKNIDGDKNTISLIHSTTANQGLSVSATPRVSFTDYDGVYREFEVGSVYAEGDQVGLITSIETLRALLDTISIAASISIEDMDFSFENLDPDDRIITIVFSAYKSGSLIL